MRDMKRERGGAGEIKDGVPEVNTLTHFALEDLFQDTQI